MGPDLLKFPCFIILIKKKGQRIRDKNQQLSNYKSALSPGNYLEMIKVKKKQTLANTSPCTTELVVKSNVELWRIFTSSVPDSISIHRVSVMYLAPFWSMAWFVISLCIILMHIWKGKMCVNSVHKDAKGMYVNY